MNRVRSGTQPRAGEQILRRGGIRLNLLRSCPTKTRRYSGCSVLFWTPDGGQQRAMRHHFCRTPCKINQEVELFWCEMNFMPHNLDAACIQIDGKITGGKSYWAAPRPPASAAIAPGSAPAVIHAETAW